MSCPVKVLENAELGRYSVADRNINAGEVLFEENPFAIGPKADSFPVCLECCRSVDGNAGGPKCPLCGWPMCEDCSENLNNIVNHKKECALFVENKVKFQNVKDSNASCVQLDCITPLRVLLQKEDQAERWNAEITLMEYHPDARKDTAIWKADQRNVVEYLRGPCGLKDCFSEELIQRVIGILAVNAFEARTNCGSAIRGLYPKLAIMSHSCVPNVVHSIYPSDNYRLVARAAVDVAEGEKLHTTYTYTLYGTSLRQNSLKVGKYFTCHCARCLDPTELGTHFSSLNCERCCNGLIESSNPLDDQADWKCTHCEFTIKGETALKKTQYMQNEVDKVGCLNDGREKLDIYERLLQNFTTILHPLHFINTTIRDNLIQLYGRIPGYRMSELPDTLLERKVELCKDVLKILNVFEPGKSRARAMVLYELHAPIVLLAKSNLSRGKLEVNEFKKKLELAIELLQECATILEWEDSCTSEGILARISKQAALQLKQTRQMFS
ncbi:SET domain-containing protein SmydA-8 [Wyeomyia smithii]|uniref:SET domain-containing protein SmydA-8 n=1 Tax=Wyeomyia smithii TaxID=174621 RepID=UPI002467E792|nr:SET domain-containing protein SmydA-8 [Wyeomyia smithii]XP_055542479.1 SET domain-containing protein SmydA-8 [Wyeomyia smithii]